MAVKLINPNEVVVNGKSLTDILKDHKHWFYKSCVGWQKMHANLRQADLSFVDLSGAFLCGADLSYAILHGTCLQHANMWDANLQSANLGAADLSYANLTNANLCDAFMKEVDLTNANMLGANLHSANLHDSDLTGAILDSANLHGAIMHDVTGPMIDYRKGKILSEPMIGYKKCQHGILVTLEIPRGAIVFSINGTKCRTNRAKVISIEKATRAISSYKYMSYYVGDEFNMYNFNCEYNAECETGIHFFTSREDAINY